MVQREIKFKVFDGVDYVSNPFTLADIQEGKVQFTSRTIVMQFTGLVDKAGEPIYEDDILEFVGGTCDFLPNGIYSSNRYGIGAKLIVQKLLSGFTLCGVNMIDCDIPNRVGKVDNYTFWNHHSSLKIIGNIHQNPELLIK